MFPLSSISNANRVQAQPGSLRYPSPKNSPPDCFSRKSSRFFGRLMRVPLLQVDKKRRSHKWDLLFLAEKGGLEPPRQFLDRPTPLAGAPRHQLEYFSRLVSGLRLYSLLETAVLNSFLFLCRERRFFGGEGGIRTHGSCESLVFKTSSLNHSDTSPSSNDDYFIITDSKSQGTF